MDLSGIARAGERAAPPVETFTAKVIRSDQSGLWVAPLGDDERIPVGPCRGGWNSNGGRVQAGAIVMLAQTAQGPWVVGLDDPARLIPEAAATVPNGSFEEVDGAGRAARWSKVDQQPTEVYQSGGVSTLDTLSSGAAHGVRFLRATATANPPAPGFTVNSHFAFAYSDTWQIVGSGPSIQFAWLARRGSLAAKESSVFVFSAPPGEGPVVPAFGNPLPGEMKQAGVLTFIPGTDWQIYRGLATIPAGHTRVCLAFRVFASSDETSQTPSVLDIDNVTIDASLENDQTIVHADYIRRATATLAGGGNRVVTAGGNISWSQPFTIAGAGFRVDQASEGRFDITMPAAGIVIPVHSSSARTSHTVAGGVIALDPDEALWYELPLGAAAASQSSRFHILGSTNNDQYAVPPHWILVVRRRNWSATSHAPEYVWGDRQPQDPWRTPALNAGWVDGTLPGRFTKTGSGLVVMRGRVRSGAGSAFTLPPGYVPGTQHEAVVRDGAGAPALITVTTAGVVTTAGNNTDHSIATTFVAAEQ